MTNIPKISLDHFNMVNTIKISANKFYHFFSGANENDHAVAAAQVAQAESAIALTKAETAGSNPNTIKVMEHTYYEGPGCSNAAAALTSHLIKGEYQPCVKKKSYYLAKIGNPNQPISDVVNDPKDLETKKSSVKSELKWAKESNSLALNKTPKEYRKFIEAEAKKQNTSVSAYTDKQTLLRPDEFDQYHASL